ncbi:polysaccharide pyruvyl transferase CsaB [Tepidibacter thalassicus]|uniref:Polysaccharide pyruvyl transferase CsaB n=1 Tax=Tepidibacter thalassicus DSM 15285 TaxID=1123350 RepID=A0A1M5TD75_9FIRM|nr:polysaccharide pyruvyl transferase CsaB [Tepidibacter thalassicus]SHH48631.1 polysaccharide pyruvyl transferase CsaB [Tepidibacter thalassicus DSM 15285]
MKSIFIFGYYGFQNIGDEAILSCIINDLRKFISNPKIKVLTYNAELTKKEHGVDTISRTGIVQVIKAIKESDLVISGGGSLLQDVTSSRSLIYYLSLIFFAKLFNKKVMFYNNGYGPVNKKLNKFFIKKILKKVDLITLRDVDSKRELEKVGLRNNNINVNVDTTFTLMSSDEKKLDEIFRIESIPFDKKIVGISPRKWRNDGRTKEVIANAIDYISSKGLNVVLIPMKYPDDLEYCNQIKEICNSNPYIIKNYYSPKDVLGIIGRCHFLIGIRLHALIFAAAKLVPMIGIEYDPKNKSFLEMVSQKNAGRIEDIEEEDLFLYIDDVLKNIDVYREILKDKTKNFKDMALKTGKMASELIDE